MRGFSFSLKARRQANDKSERLVCEVGFDGRTQTYGYSEQGQLAYWQGSTRQAHYTRGTLDRVTQVDYRHSQRQHEINEAYSKNDPRE